MENLENKTVCIMLSTYNGEKYLKPLLDSLVAQRGITKTIVARDDGSKDNTPNILKEYKENGKINKLIIEPNVGFARSFHKLMENAYKSDYYAWSDQDDIWDDNKIYYGVKALEKEDNSIPLVYWCSFRSMDKNNKVYSKKSKRTKFKKGSDSFINALNSNDIRGCTCVFNQKALDMMLSLGEFGYRYHDWMIQLICCAFGKEIYDPIPHINYRCHENNCFGPAGFNIASLKRAINFIKNVEFKNNHSKTAQEFYNAFYDQMTNQKQKDYINLVINYKTDKKAKKDLLNKKEFFNSMPPFLRRLLRYSIKHDKY